jgi:hypothetical protein
MKREKLMFPGIVKAADQPLKVTWQNYRTVHYSGGVKKVSKTKITLESTV